MKTAFYEFPIKIILAEDDIDDQELFQDALNSINISTQLTIVSNGQILINLLKDNVTPLPDIIFLDIRMPCINGIECLTYIRLNNLLKAIPCVVFSTSAFDMEVAHKEGANLYVVKPYKFEDWIKTIEKVLYLDWKDYFPPAYESFLMPYDYL